MESSTTFLGRYLYRKLFILNNLSPKDVIYGSAVLSDTLVFRPYLSWYTSIFGTVAYWFSFLIYLNGINSLILIVIGLVGVFLGITGIIKKESKRYFSILGILLSLLGVILYFVGKYFYLSDVVFL